MLCTSQYSSNVNKKAKTEDVFYTIPAGLDELESAKAVIAKIVDDLQPHNVFKLAIWLGKGEFDHETL